MADVSCVFDLSIFYLLRENKNPSQCNLMKRTSGSRRENKRKEDRAGARAGLPRRRRRRETEVEGAAEG